MSYFEGIKKGDRVWDFEYGWGTVVKVEKDIFRVCYDFGDWNDYDFNGKKVFDKRTDKRDQTLFWGEINFDIPEKPKIELMEDGYLICLNDNIIDNDIDFVDPRVGDSSIDNGMFREDRETAEKALKQIRSFTRLLALRDQECIDSRGYSFKEGNKNYYIHFVNADNKYKISEHTYTNTFQVYFKTEKDAQKICDILNSGKFILEGE